MPFNGSGTFTRLRNWVNDATAGILIRADYHDSEDDNFAQGLSQCITKDGQTTVTANLPMATYKHTNVGNASSRTDYAAYGQVQDGLVNWVDAGGTADAITAAYNPSITSLSSGQICYVRAGAANATTTPTFSPSGLTARTIVKYGGQALVAGDIYGDGHELILRYDASNTRWELLNPAITVTTISAQPLDAELTAIAGLTSAANKIPMFSGSETATLIDLIDDDDFSSASSTSVPTSESVKAYIDTELLPNRAYAQYTANSNLTAQIPRDDTIPQSSEGTQILSAFITPSSDTARIAVYALAQGCSSAGSQVTMAAFVDSVSNGIMVGGQIFSASQTMEQVCIIDEFVPGTDEEIEVSIRIGPDRSDTVRLNGEVATRLFGGISKAVLILREL